jgi:hypothetical protein
LVLIDERSQLLYHLSGLVGLDDILPAHEEFIARIQPQEVQKQARCDPTRQSSSAVRLGDQCDHDAVFGHW